MCDGHAMRKGTIWEMAVSVSQKVSNGPFSHSKSHITEQEDLDMTAALQPWLYYNRAGGFGHDSCTAALVI